MTMTEFEYRSVGGKQAAEIKVKGSRFIGIAIGVNDETDVKAHLQHIKLEYPKATHYCYAYILDFEGNVFRANDDGEPSATAGLPILGQIRALGLSKSMVVVVRYYGGTKLGASGLISAYKEVAKQVLNQAQITQSPILLSYKIEFEYESIGQIHRLLQSHEAQITSQEYDTRSQIAFQLPKANAEPFESAFSAIAFGLGKVELSRLKA